MTYGLGLGIGMCFLNPPKTGVKEFYSDRFVLLQFKTNFFMLHLQLATTRSNHWIRECIFFVINNNLHDIFVHKHRNTENT